MAALSLDSMTGAFTLYCEGSEGGMGGGRDGRRGGGAPMVCWRTLWYSPGMEAAHRNLSWPRASKWAGCSVRARPAWLSSSPSPQMVVLFNPDTYSGAAYQWRHGDIRGVREGRRSEGKVEEVEEVEDTGEEVKLKKNKLRIRAKK